MAMEATGTLHRVVISKAKEGNPPVVIITLHLDAMSVNLSEMAALVSAPVQVQIESTQASFSFAS